MRIMLYDQDETDQDDPIMQEIDDRVWEKFKHTVEKQGRDIIEVIEELIVSSLEEDNWDK